MGQFMNEQIDALTALFALQAHDLRKKVASKHQSLRDTDSKAELVMSVDHYGKTVINFKLTSDRLFNKYEPPSKTRGKHASRY